MTIADQVTLGARLSERDARRFVGRAAELAMVDRLLVDDPPASVVLVHGEGGIGKSTLLREVARRGAAHGFEPLLVDGRELPPVPGAVEAALAPAFTGRRPLVLLDTWELHAASTNHLRTRLLPGLPGGAVVVIAGRGPPDPEWFAGGWEALVLTLHLGPLGTDEAVELVRAHGLSGDELIADVVAWAEGSPLGLALAAQVAGTDSPAAHAGLLEQPELVRALIRQLARTELDGGNLDVAAVAAIARRTTRGMLRDVLPGVDPRAAEAWLRSLTITETLGAGVTLHDLMRTAMRSDLRLRDPERERELRRRIADHLYVRARAGNPWLLVDLAHLVENPAIRWGFGAEGSVDHRVDIVRPGDAETIAPNVLSRGGTRRTWETTRRFFEEAPERVIVARDRMDAVVGYCIAVTPDNAPPLADIDPILGPWLAYARERFPDGEVVIWRDSLDLTAGVEGDPGSHVLAILNTAAILRSGVNGPRWMMLPIDPRNQAALAFSAGVGAQRIEGLDAHLRGIRLECHLADVGEGGPIGALRRVVYAELGLPDPGDAALPSVEVDAETIKAALRAFHRPAELATSPLASGATPQARAASVRAQLQAAIDGAFGHTADEELLRTIVTRGYVDLIGGHERNADELFLSRATYFRRLRQASNRVAAWMLARAAD